jgi:hypothetical protein
MTMRQLLVSGSYQNYHNEAATVSNQLTDVGRRGEESVLGVSVNLFMCDRGAALYSVHDTCITTYTFHLLK